MNFYYIITIHNKEDMLRQVLDGIIKSSSEKRTIIAVLDGCEDSSEFIVDEYIQNGVNIKKILLNDVHELISLNTAFRYIINELSTDGGDIITTVQDDVVLDEPDFENLIDKCFLEKNVKYISLRAGCEVVSNTTNVTQHEFVESEFGHWKQINANHFVEMKHYDFVYKTVVIKSPTCVRAATLKEIGLFDENLQPFGHDDLDFCLRLAKLGYKCGVYALKFRSDLGWGGTRSPKDPQKDYHKHYGGIVSRNGAYLAKKHRDYFTGEYKAYSFCINDFLKFSKEWVNTPEYNDFIYDYFDKKVQSIKFLNDHSEFVGRFRMGFGERPFIYLWALLVSQMNYHFDFLEIGVYKGAILSLIKNISNHFGKFPNIVGVTPLSSVGDKYSSYENVNYSECIRKMFSEFQLDMSQTTIVPKKSTDQDVIRQLTENYKFDMIYIDGGHDYETVVSDILLSKKIIKPNGFIVLDDASHKLNLGKLAGFWGHADVGNAVSDVLDSDNNYKQLFVCGHNRVFRRIS